MPAFEKYPGVSHHDLKRCEATNYRVNATEIGDLQSTKSSIDHETMATPQSPSVNDPF
jgi:hypothetical protein